MTDDADELLAELRFQAGNAGPGAKRERYNAAANRIEQDATALEIMRDKVETFGRALDERDATIAELRAALDVAEESLDQMLDDMGETGQCVCGQAKDEAITAMAVVHAALKPTSERDG